MTNVTLRLLIRQAYQLQDFQITGGPSWLASDHFDVIAKMPDGFQPPPGPPAPGSGPGPLQLMLRGLLAERFKLAVHNETKDSPIYALILARSDGKLGTAAEEIGDRLRRDVRRRRGRGRGPMPPPGPPQPGESIPCGMRIGPGNLVMGGSPLSQFANSLGMFTGRIVLDRTGLTGNYDFNLTWTPDQMPAAAGRSRWAAANQRRRRRSERAVAVHRGAGATRAQAGFAARTGRGDGHRSRREAGRELTCGSRCSPP